jgi:hypothetical protein
MMGCEQSVSLDYDAVTWKTRQIGETVKLRPTGGEFTLSVTLLKVRDPAADEAETYDGMAVGTDARAVECVLELCNLGPGTYVSTPQYDYVALECTAGSDAESFHGFETSRNKPQVFRCGDKVKGVIVLRAIAGSELTAFKFVIGGPDGLFGARWTDIGGTSRR